MAMLVVDLLEKSISINSTATCWCSRCAMASLVLACSETTTVEGRSGQWVGVSQAGQLAEGFHQAPGQQTEQGQQAGQQQAGRPSIRDLDSSSWRLT